MVPSSPAGCARYGHVLAAGRRNLLSLLPFAYQRCKAGRWAAHAVLSTSSYRLPQPPAALWGWVNEQQSCWHNPAFMAPAAFGKSCQPPPCSQGLWCSTAITQLCSQGPSLASASLRSVALLPQPLQGCPLPAGPGDHPRHCSLSPPASPIPTFICLGRNRSAVVLVS